jgi:diguanylate cyclase (GGDEF)-like protein/PAS domain S-box-containing protein
LDDFDLFDVDDALEAAVLTQKSLVDTQDRLGVVLDIMPIGLLIHTEQGILFANQAACGLLHTDRAVLVGQHLLDFVRASDMDAVATQFGSSFKGGEETLRGEAAVGRSDGPQRLVRLITGKLPWEGNPVIQVLLEDITDQRRAENSLRQQAITDELTGAYNRRHAFYEAALHVEASRERGVPFSVAMFDIDHFKKINDTRGHAVGDLALKAITALANEKVPLIEGTDSAMFARLGGEEFVILLPGLGLEAAMTIADDFRRAVEQMVVEAPGGDFKFTISGGVAALCDKDGDFARMLTRSDEALYEAKGAGRNRVMAAH